METPVLTPALTRKGARYAKPHVQMVASVLLVRQFASSNRPHNKGQRKSISFQLVSCFLFFFLYDFTLKSVNKLFLLV